MSGVHHDFNGNLVKMANQIGSFFEAMPDREEAMTDIAGHIKRFWAPSMRNALLSHIDAGNAGELLEVVRDAVARHRGELQPAEPVNG
jgi:formate dehydrogenase subunit delta